MKGMPICFKGRCPEAYEIVTQIQRCQIIVAVSERANHTSG